MPPAITVIVVNYNAGPHLAKTVAGLAAQTDPDFLAVIVDNASQDSSLALARACIGDDPRFTFLLQSTNTGFAAGNNLAAAHADTPWIALLNPDAIPAPDWLARLLAATKRHPTATMFGSMQLSQEDTARLDGAGDRYLAAGIAWRGGYGWPREAAPPEGEVFAPCAAAALYRLADWRSAGGLEESFFCYVEDVDLAFRLRLQGQHCIQVPDAVVHHAGSVTSGGAGSAFARYHGTRNMIWCFLRNMPGLLFWPLLPLHALAMAGLWLRAMHSGMGPAVSRGIADALRALPLVWQQRRAIQLARRAGSLQVARWLVWNPLVYLRRAPGLLK
jgi:N-acetylglucosaminyl-diphospho-decaprenol L-rhamnosyltransferase